MDYIIYTTCTKGLSMDKCIKSSVFSVIAFALLAAFCPQPACAMEETLLDFKSVLNQSDSSVSGNEGQKGENSPFMLRHKKKIFFCLAVAALACYIYFRKQVGEVNLEDLTVEESVADDTGFSVEGLLGTPYCRYTRAKAPEAVVQPEDDKNDAQQDESNENEKSN